MAGPTKIKAKLEDITPFGDDVFKLDFAVERKYTRFQPGQFLHLTLDRFDPTQAYWPESRVFSICSEPRSDRVSLIYSVKGGYTRRMQEELAPGREYWLKLPYGDFIIEELLGRGDAAVLIAGGTGVSPYVPYLHRFLSGEVDRNIYLAYAVRSPDRLVFDELLKRVADHPQATVRVWSEVAPESGSDHRIVTDVGLLDLDTVIEDTQHNDQLPNRHFFLSGPPGMLESFSRRLEDVGVGKERIHIDEWE